MFKTIYIYCYLKIKILFLEIYLKKKLNKDLLIISIIKNYPIFLKYEKSKFIYKF